MLDNQAGVDSGFSSSSPADRQSPSPESRFSRDVTEEEKPADNSPTSADTTAYLAATRTSPSTTEEANNPSLFSPTLPHHQNQNIISGGPMCGKEFKQELVDQSYGDLSQRAASLNSGAVPVYPSVSQTLQSAPAFPSAMSTSTHLEAMDQLSANVLDLSATAPPSNGQGAPGAPCSNSTQGTTAADTAASESMKSALDSLTAQITGNPPNLEARQSESNDPSFLVKHNKIAEAPRCRCVNRPRMFVVILISLVVCAPF